MITNTPESNSPKSNEIETSSPELSDASEIKKAKEYKARSAKLVKNLIGGQIRDIFIEFQEGFIDKGMFTEEEIIDLAIEQIRETMEQIK